MFHSAAGLLVPVKATQTTTSTKPAPPRKSKSAVKPAEQARPAGTSSEAAQPVAASASGTPLGLRYSIHKQTSGSRTAEVDADTVFRSGDRIRLAVEANDNAYLYIVQRGSSGNWSLLFPTPEIAGGNNLVKSGQRYEIPAGHWFTFDEQAGEEQLFIVLYRQPEPNLEQMIYALQKQDAPPAAQPPEEKPAKVLMAGNRIDDSLINKIRGQVVARDLVFEKVSESSGEKSEKAVYVVNRTGAAESRIVADVKLNHR